MIYQLQSNRVWRSYLGGRNIEQLQGQKEAQDGCFPEEWVASVVLATNPGHEREGEGLSRTVDGALLRDLIAENPEAMLGRGNVARHGAHMSILVKILDAAERLVVQAHPTRAFAQQYFASPYGKTESWYLIKTGEDACIYLGFKPGITRTEWVRCFEAQDISRMLDWLHRLAVKPGDVVLVEGGTPHAIGAGCFMIELQEPTDLIVTPERQTLSGLPFSDKKMHAGLGFERMFDCFAYEGMDEQEIRRRYFIQPEESREPENQALRTLIGRQATDKFCLQELLVDGTAMVSWPDDYVVAVVLRGSGQVQELTADGKEPNGQTGGPFCTLKPGDQLFIPADAGPLLWTGQLQVVICRP